MEEPEVEDPAVSSEAMPFIGRWHVDDSDQNPGWCGYFWGLDYPVLPSCIGICLLHVASLYRRHVLEFTCCGLVCCVASCFFTCTREASAQCCGEVPVHHVISTYINYLLAFVHWPSILTYWNLNKVFNTSATTQAFLHLKDLVPSSTKSWKWWYAKTRHERFFCSGKTCRVSFGWLEWKSTLPYFMS